MRERVAYVSDKKKYADIYVTDLYVQGVAVEMYHKLKEF